MPSRGVAVAGSSLMGRAVGVAEDGGEESGEL